MSIDVRLNLDIHGMLRMCQIQTFDIHGSSYTDYTMLLEQVSHSGMDADVELLALQVLAELHLPCMTHANDLYRTLIETRYVPLTLLGMLCRMTDVPCVETNARAMLYRCGLEPGQIFVAMHQTCDYLLGNYPKHLAVCGVDFPDMPEEAHHVRTEKTA